jgi:adenosyl cobinamide kinase/adenosyl cobinamide phosphate guanylyltransferase
MSDPLKPVNIPFTIPNLVGEYESAYQPGTDSGPDYHNTINSFIEQNSKGKGQDLPTVSSDSIDLSGRYPLYFPKGNNEEMYANAQSGLEQATNGVLKGLNLTATTIAGGFGMLYGAAKAPFSGRLADIWDNEAMRVLDKWNQDVDQNYLPNYYTEKETNSSWYSTDNWMTTNFLFDKLIKNAGYAVGAMVGGNLANAGLKVAGAGVGTLAARGAIAAESAQAFKLFTPLLRNTARAFSNARNIEAAAILEKEISSIADLSVKTSKIAELAKLNNQIANLSDKGRRIAVAVYSSSGEAAFEALQTGNEFRANLIEKYRNDNFGQDPTGKDLENINVLAETVGKTSFFGNLALLGVTEYVQLPKLLGSSYSADKQAANSLLGITDDVLLKEGKYATKVGATTKFGKLYQKSARIAKYAFDPKEAGQEIGQYALQIGTENYFSKAFKGDEADAWVDGFLYGMVGEDDKGEGVGALNSKAGIEGGLLGGITGGAMQTFGPSGNIARSKARKSNTQKFVEELNNAPTAKEAFIERKNAINRGVQLQQEQEQAVIEGDELEAKDLKTDLTHNYLAPRIKYGRFDMVMGDIADLRATGMSEEGLANLKEQGIANINDTVETYQKRLSSFETSAKTINELYKSLNLRYGGAILTDEQGQPILDFEGKQLRKYAPAIIDRMVYAASKIADYDLRIPELSARLMRANVPVQDVINDELSNDMSVTLAKTLAKIDEQKSERINTDAAKDELKQIVELALRRKLYVKEYNDLKENPNGYTPTGEKTEYTPEGKKTRTTVADNDNSDYFSKSRDKFKSDERTYEDLVSQYGEGETNKATVLEKIIASPYATVLEKQLAAAFLPYTSKDSKIILGDRTLSSAGVSKTGADANSAVSRINYEDNAADYEGGSLPVEHVLLHEIGHDLTAFALTDENGQFYKDLNPLFEFIKDHFKNDPDKYAEAGLIKNGEYYAFKNIFEFATEALSNREFQRYMQTIPFKNTQTSTWETFINAVKTFFRRLFGTTNETLLTEVIAVITNNIDATYKSVQEKNKKIADQQATLLKNKEYIIKTQVLISNTSGDTATPDTSILTVKEPPKKEAEEYFVSTTTESETWENTENSAPHVIRSRRFLNKAKKFKNRGSIKAILVTAKMEAALGLTGLAQLSYGNNPMDDVNNPLSGFLASVFVVQEKGKSYFVDEDGNKLSAVGDQVDLDKVVFQTMPTPALTYSDGSPRFRRGEEKDLAAYAKGWSIFREAIFALDGTKKTTPMSFVISRGLPKTLINSATNTKEKNAVGDVLVDESIISKQKGLIVIPTTGTIAHNGKLIAFPNGVPVLQFGDTLEMLDNRKFSKKEAASIYQVLKALSKETIEQSEKGEALEFNPNYITFLQNILYWKLGTTASPNQIRINEDTLSIQIGTKSYSIAAMDSYEKEIVDQLTDAFISVNNKTLKDNFSGKFTEYTLDDDNNLKEVKWKNYQTYLLANKNPDGSSRTDIPLTTSVAKPTEAVPYTHIAKYATLIGVSFPVEEIQETSEEVPVKKFDTVPSTPTETFVLDGNTPNTIAIAEFGNVTFVMSDNGEPSFNESNQEFINTRKAIIEATNTAREKAGQPFADQEQLLLQVNNYIISFIKKAVQVQKEPVVPIAPAYVFDGKTINTYTIDNFGTISFAVKKGEDPKFVNNEGFKQVQQKFIAAVKATTPGVSDKNAMELANGAIITLVNKAIDNTPPPPNAPKAGDTIEPSDEFRLVNNDSSERMTPEELEIFKEWHAENVPNIPYEVLERMIITHTGEEAWGVFTNGVAKFVRGGLKGTEYHEIFHGIFKGFLSNEEQDALYNEMRSKSGSFTDRSSKKDILYSEATNYQLRDKLSDDFAAYRLGKLPARTFGEKVRRFFKAILDFFKSFVANPSLKDKLFDAIDSGKFKNEKLAPINYIAEYRAADGLTEEQTRNIVQDMVARAAGILFSEGRKDLLYSAQKMSGEEMFAKIEARYEKEGRLAVISEEAWKDLKKKAKRKLKTLGITIKDNDDVDINSENANKNDYTSTPFSTDWKKTSKGAVKFTMATLFETIPTNQEDSTSLMLPETAKTLSTIKDVKLKGYKLLNYNRTFATVLDKLSNTTDFAKAVDKLINLAEYDSNYVRLFGYVSKVSGKDFSKTIPFDQFDEYDWRFFIDFMQTFTKQKPNAVIQYVSEDGTYNGAANLYTAIKETQREWVENIKTLSTDPKSLITINRNEKTYEVKSLKGRVDQDQGGRWRSISPNKEITYHKTEEEAKIAAKASDIKINSVKRMIEFLSRIGVEFPAETHARLKENQKNSFAQQVSSIYTHISEGNGLMSLTTNNLKISGPLNELAQMYNLVTNPNQDSTYFGVGGKKINAFAQNNFVSVFENIFNEVDTLNELFEVLPELKDVYSTHSQILRPGGLFFDEDGNRIKSIKVGYIQGTKLTDDNKGVATADLSLGDRFVQEINQNLEGDYYTVIPADSATEWMMNLGNTITFKEVQGNKYSKRYNTIFTGYLKDEVALALDYKNKENLKALKNNSKELRFFKDILFKKQLDAINEMIEDNATQEAIEKYINLNSKDINLAIEVYLQNTVDKTQEILSQDGKITSFEVGEVPYFTFKNINDKFVKTAGLNKNKLSEKNLNDVLTFVNANYIINMMEYHKVLFGDPYQFEIKKDGGLDEPKRIKLFLSPRNTMFDSAEYNNFLNEKENVVAGVELKEGDPGYHEYKSYTNTVTLTDVKIVGSLANLSKAFGNVNEVDGFSWLMDATHKEIALKEGQWGDDSEAFHQWQMAWTRQNLPGYTYASETLKNHDIKLISKAAPKYKLAVRKPIVSGVKHNKQSIDLVVDKFAQMPIYYSMVKGTAMEKLYLQMMNEGYGYAIFESGRKVGAEETHALYNPDGSYNATPFNNNIQVSWKSYGTQVETISDNEKQQTRGTQITKIATIDLFENGEPIGDTLERKLEIQELYNENTDLLNKMHENGYNELLNDLGITDEDGEYTMESGKNISETLMNEMLKRDMDDDAIDTLELNEFEQFKIPFEASPSYVQIRNILYSMVNKAIQSPKVSGGAHVQVPVTLFEKATKNRSLLMKNNLGVWEKITKETYDALSDADKKKVALGDDTLKFYEDADGKRVCQVMIPHWFKGKFGKKTDKEILQYLNTPEGRKILAGIGFRIPTQSLSSIEVFEVAGFLPAYMGSTVVVPSEITTKAGSDFDIDKLNMYLKAVYVDANGNVKLVTYKGSEQATKDFYEEVFKKTIQKEIDKVEKYSIFRQRLFSIFDTLEGLSSPLSEEDQKFYDVHEELINDIIEQADEKDMLPSEYILDQIQTLTGKASELDAKLLSQIMKQAFVKDMYKKALENEYYASLEKIITLPENFKRLIEPVSDGGLKDVAARLNDLQGTGDKDVKARLLDRNYITNLRHSFIIAKKWVGIAAVSITNLSLKQKSTVYIDTNRTQDLSEEDAKFIGDGKMILPHNSIEINGEEYISLSGTTVKDSEELISTRYSGYATSFVDVAKDPFIMSIIKSNLIVGTFMFLENAGVGSQSAFFLNQPIIQEYLKLVESRGDKWLFSNKNISSILLKFPTTEKLMETIGIDLNNFEKNIEDYYKTKKGDLGEARNAEQQKIFYEFLKYAKMAEFNFKFTQATNYDTTKFGSGEELTKKQLRTTEALDNNIISSIDNILSTTFIGDQEYYLNKSMESMGAVLKLEQTQFRAITDEVLKQYATNTFLSKDDYNKIALQVKASFLDYIIQTKLGVNERINELLVDGSTSVATRLEQAKQDYPGVEIIKELQVVSSSRVDGAKSIKLRVSPTTAEDINYYKGLMREMRDTDQELRALYNDIVLVSILQGTQASSISIKNIIPLEDYSAIVTPIITSLVNDGSLSAFEKGMFQRNNFKNTDVIKSYSPRFRQKANSMVIDNWTGDEVYSYYSPAFISIEELDVIANRRQIMFVPVKDAGFISNDDFVTVPRVITYFGTKIDFITGETVKPSDFKIRKDKGDLSLKDVFGYQKVKLDTGEPLIHVTKDAKGNRVENYVYKLINLYGDGQYASEYYNDFRESALSNGTRHVKNEIPNADIINHFSQTTLAEQTPIVPSAETESVPVNKGKLQMEPENIDKIKNGTKSITNRAVLLENGIYTLPEGTEVLISLLGEYIVTQNVSDLTNPEAPVFTKDEFAVKEGFKDWNDFNTNNKYSANFIKGLQRRYVYSVELMEESTITPQSSVIEVVDRYSVADVQANPDKIYVFGDNLQRTGTGGQAVIRNNSNAMGIVTKLKPTMNDDAFMSDNEIDMNRQNIDNDIAKIKATGKVVVLPKDGFGTGLAKLKEKAPQTYAYLKQRLLEEFGFDNDTGNILAPAPPVQVSEQTKNKNEIDFQEEQTVGYKNRTIKNASADATIAIAVDFGSAGEILTKKSVIEQGKKYIPVNISNTNDIIISEQTVEKIVEQLNAINTGTLFNDITLNIAGNGIYTMKGVYTQTQLDGYVQALLEAVINHPDLKNKISSLRTGGQTGIDEAGAKAGIALGIPTTILAPKGWTFRNIDGSDISNEQQFKDRFTTAAPVPQTRQIQVEQFKITINPDGKMFYANGKELTDQTTINKVNVRKELQDGTLRVSVYNKANYFVLLDGRIVGSGKTNLGKESITDPKIKEAILAKAVTYKKEC